MKYIVYQTINLINNKIYIGVHKTKNPEIFDGYIGCGIIITNPSTYNNPTTPLQYAVKKYGTSNFRRSILFIFNTAEEAFAKEMDIVNKDFINRKDTYNAKLGGIGGSSYSTKIYQFNLKGLLVNSWNSIIEAAEFYNISDTVIYNAYKFKDSCKGFYWSINNTINITEYSNIKRTICYKYNLSGKLINTYNSISEASIDSKVTMQEIERAIKGGYRVRDNYYSSKIYEEYTGKSKISLKNKNLYVYDLDGNFIVEFKNSKDICKFFNIKTTHPITLALRLERPYKEYQFSLEKKEKMDKAVNKRNIRKKVGQYTLEGKFVKMFDSITAACKEFGTGVQKVLKGQQQQCKNFIFKYIS